MALKNPINILSWNANSIKYKCNELSQTILDYNLDIIGLCETKINDNYNLSIKGFHVYRNNRDNRGGGVALAINKNIKQTFYNLPQLNSVEAVAAQIHTPQGQVLLICMYIPPKNKLNINDIRILFNLQNKTILFGDLNARNKIWNCLTNNSNGKLINSFCSTHNYIIHAPDEPTFYPPQQGFRLSTIDLFITKNFNHLSKPISLSILSSNHNPIFSEIDFDFTYSHQKQINDLKNANWHLYKNIINENLDLSHHISNKTDIDNAITLLQNLMNQAFSESVPILNHTNCHSIEPVPDYIKNLIKLKNKVRRKYQKTRNQVLQKFQNFLNYIINKNIKIWKNSM